MEEVAAGHEEERYGWRQPSAHNESAGAGLGPLAPREPRPPPAPPSHLQSGGGCHFIKRGTWARLASAFPVFEDPQTNERYHEPVSYRQLKDLMEAVHTYGVTANYTVALLRRIATTAMTPTDWSEIAKACLSKGQFLDFKSIVTDNAHVQARVNAQNNHPQWTADMLLGQGQWAANQLGYPQEVYRQINDICYRAWKSLNNKGEVKGHLTKIIQGPNEPFSDFVARMLDMAGKIVGDVDQVMPLVQQIVFEQSTKECQGAITPVKEKGMEAWLKACREIGGPLTNAGLAAAVLSATQAAKTKRGGGCFKCGQQGHFRRQCPLLKGLSSQAQTPNVRRPGLCPRCKNGKHWSNECRSLKDINGQPIVQFGGQESKNGLRGPRPQGPKIYGALQQTTIPNPTVSAEQPLAQQGWTSVPPPDWY